MKNSVVVDASITIKWAIKEDDSSIAIALLTEWTDKGMSVLAPALLAYEAANAFYRHVRSGTLPLEDAQRGLREVVLKTVDLYFVRNSDLNIRAMELAGQFGLSATYDAHYLALAEREDCDLWTADLRLWNTVKGKLDRVRWLGDYSLAKHEEG